MGADEWTEHAARREGFGWQVRTGAPGVMAQLHQHDEIEINLVYRGAITYLRRGQIHRLEGGQVGVFWGATPHRLLSCEEGTHLSWITLPSISFQRFGLPSTLKQAIWGGALLIDQQQPVTAEVFAQWEHDPESPEYAAIAQLEVEAWLRRFALRARSHDTAPPEATGDTVSSALNHALRLAWRLQQEFMQPLRVQALAAEFNLHPHYLSGQFRKVFGMSMRQYLLRCRLAHAQALLISTDLSVLSVALESGFGSTSRFFSAFEERHHCSPRVYRQRHRNAEGGSTQDTGPALFDPSA